MNSPLTQNDIIDTVNAIVPQLHGCMWIVGGSAALVLQGERETANDIDIIQHTGPEIILNKHYETRMWSKYYADTQIDMHYSNPYCMHGHDKVFHDIIRAISYIDSKHSIPYNNFWIATPNGGGLINWVHHFLEYGFNIERTISPKNDDEVNLRTILGEDKYNTLSWKVEMNLIENPNANQNFKEFVKNSTKTKGIT